MHKLRNSFISNLPLAKGTPSPRNRVAQTMAAFRDGNLRIGGDAVKRRDGTNGAIVTDRKLALKIALKDAGLAKAFDETKHKRNHGEFAATGTAAAPGSIADTGVRSAQLVGGAAGGLAAGSALSSRKIAAPVRSGVERFAARVGNGLESRFRLATRRNGLHITPAASKVLRSQGKGLNLVGRMGAKLAGRAGIAGAAFAAGDYIGDRLSQHAAGGARNPEENGYRHFNAAGFALGSVGAAAAHAAQHARFARKLIRRFPMSGRLKLLGAGLAATAALEATGTRIQDRVLGKAAPAGIEHCADERVAGMLPHADRILHRAGKAHTGGATDPHVAMMMGDVHRLLGTVTVEPPRSRLENNAAVGDHTASIAHLAR